MEDYNSKYTGEQVEEMLDQIASGELGGIVSETDPIFSASPAASITEAKKAEWDGKQEKITDLDAIRSGAAAGATALQSVPSEYVTETELTNKGYATTSALNNKVDKVSGKQLTTEDFTSALKSKLEGLSNYDDTELSNALSTLRGDFDKLVSGDTTTAIKTFNEVIAFLDGIQDTQDLSSIIASIEQQIAGKMDKVTLATVATSGSYNDLSNKPTIPSEQVNADWNATSGKAQILNKPTIPSAVTESTVSGWGFTKNTGTYSKPSTGIPKSDLASAVQTSLGKADTALQSYTEQYKGTVTGVKINGTTKEPSSGVVDLGTVITSHQDISGKQDKLVSGTNIKTVNGTSLLGSGNIAISGGSGTITGVSANGTSIATSGVANIPAASTSAYGVTKLSSATNSTSTSLAATASAVKAAYDLANNYKGTVTGVKVNGSTKTPSSGTVDIGNVVTSIKINGSTKTPSNGVVDLGTISGGSSSGESTGGSTTTDEPIELNPSDSLFEITQEGTYILKCTNNQNYEFYIEEKCSIIMGPEGGLSYGAITILHPAGMLYWANNNEPVFEDNKMMELSFYPVLTGLGVYSVLGTWASYDAAFAIPDYGDYE